MSYLVRNPEDRFSHDVAHIDPCVGNLHFLRGMNMQFSAVTMCMHFFTFYMSIYACFFDWCQ